MRKSKQAAKTIGDESGPTPERARHGPIERLDHAIADEAGRPARPYRGLDTLTLMLRRGTISPGMHQAAEDFRALFIAPASTRSACRIWRECRPDRARTRHRCRSARPIRAKVWAALQALGGIASPAGSCVWHVVGTEWSVKDWALRQGWGGSPVSPETASGILIGALGTLQTHFGLR